MGAIALIAFASRWIEAKVLPHRYLGVTLLIAAHLVIEILALDVKLGQGYIVLICEKVLAKNEVILAGVKFGVRRPL